MFEGALGTREGPKGRVWVGAVISVGLHAGLLAGAVWLSSGGEVKVVEEPDFKGPVLVDFRQVAKGTPAPPTQRPAAQPRKRAPRKAPRAPVTVARPVEAEPAETVEPVEPAAPEDAVVGVEVGGDGSVGPIGHPRGSCEGPGCLTEVPPHAGVQNYEGGKMTPPVLLGGRPPQYTREALAAGIEGTMIVKCVISREGEVRDCRVIKGLPHMEEEILRALSSRRYKPVMQDGVPLDVNYVLNIRLAMPR